MLKKTSLFLGFVTLMVVMFCTVAFAQYMIQPVYQNSEGQRVMDVTNDSGQVVLKVLGRGGNVYNATNGFLVASNCKGPDYFGVAQSNGALVIMWVDTNNSVWRTPASYYQPTLKMNGYTGGALNSLGSSVSNTGSTSYNTYNNTQSYTQQQYQQPYQQQYQQPNYNNQYPYGNQYSNYGYGGYYYDNRDSYYDEITATRSGDTYKYKDGSKTYTYTLRSRTLKYNSYEISDNVTNVGFIEDYIIYVTKSNDVYAVEVGRKSRGTKILDEIDKISYYSGYMIDYIRSDRTSYDEDDILDLIDDDYWDDDDDDDDDDDYPFVKKSGQKYTYYKSSSNKYVYTFEDGSVEYKNDEILDEVDTIGFSTKGYIFMLTSDGDLYRLKVGSTSSPTWIDGDISYMTVNSDYIITKIVDDDGHSLKTSDYE